mmetsp:Transcript_27051/g.67402  ORF Transcript_27051/g.67402 Transcript_27051/m.67402 type:complete len:96 (-) Transcript_27051:612-899(-)
MKHMTTYTHIPPGVTHTTHTTALIDQPEKACLPARLHDTYRRRQASGLPHRPTVSCFPLVSRPIKRATNKTKRQWGRQSECDQSIHQSMHRSRTR